MLADVAASAGVDRAAFLANLADESLLAEVLGEEMGAQQLGIQGVPATVIENRYLLSGAQPPQRLATLLQEYKSKGTINGR